MATRFSSVAVETPRERSGELEQTSVEKVKWWSKKSGTTALGTTSRLALGPLTLFSQLLVRNPPQLL